MKTITTSLLAIALAGLTPLATAGERKTFGGGALPGFLQQYDLDEDGTLSEEERQAMKEARAERRANKRARIDTDGDGKVSKEERTAARDALRTRIMERRVKRFVETDTDSDGNLSVEEFTTIPAVARLAERRPEAPAKIYDRLDANDDGTVSSEEFVSHLRKRRPHRRPGNRRDV